MTIAEIQNQSVQKPKNKGGNPNWVKGVSGNPGGRPKNFRSLREILLDTISHEEAAQELRYHVLERHNLDALQEFWDRTEGRSVQAVTVSSDDDPRAAAMRQLAEEMRLAREADAARQHYVELPPAAETT